MEPLTKLPWHWGEDWPVLEAEFEAAVQSFEEEFMPDKYMELGLIGADKYVIPIRIDHFQPFWDCSNSYTPPEKQDRDFIVHACNNYNALVDRLVNLYYTIEGEMQFDNSDELFNQVEQTKNLLKQLGEL
jgi:hypothetical protein